MNARKPIASALGVLAAGFTLAACGAGEGDSPSEASASKALPQGSEKVDLKPADFSINIDNPYWPMSPGSKWTYKEADTEGKKEKVVVEITDDWYAQDKAGNIWYLGEYVTNYQNGKVVDHSGSFEAGVDGAQAGVALPANPEPGMSYRQEYYKGEAEDKGAVVTVGEEQVQVPFGFFDKDVLMTRDLVHWSRRFRS